MAELSNETEGWGEDSSVTLDNEIPVKLPEIGNLKV